jgi:hypothetical protein
MTRKSFLICGTVSSLLYTLMNIFIPLGFDGYSYSAHTVSELSAIDAPTRSIWVPLAAAYILLFACFAWGVRITSGGNRKLRTVSTIMLVYAIVNVYWPPMHLRGVERDLTDTLHLVWAGVTVLLMIVMMVIGATALGKTFRLYTILSIVAHIVFGYMTSLEAELIATNSPTPWIGVWERINIGVFMLWIAVFSLSLLRRYSDHVFEYEPRSAGYR